MTLTLRQYSVRDIIFGNREGLRDGVLTVDREKLLAFLKEEKNIEDASLDIARPGDKTRIIHILDAIAPISASDDGNVFPGFLSRMAGCGSGGVRELIGMKLLTCGTFHTTDAILRTREAMIDMWGKGADYTPFATELLLVLTLTPKVDAELKSADAAVRLAGLKAARYLADLAKEEITPVTKTTSIESVEMEPVPGLPRVCAILQLASIGTLFDTYLYGRSTDGLLPTFLTRQELLAGAVVTDEYFYGGQRQPTCHYQHNPIIEELLEHHGKDVSFAGIIVCRGYNNTDDDKRRAAVFCANLARYLRADGVIVHPESGGNSHVDCMYTVQECERIGIRTVIIAGEMGDVGSRDVSLIDYVPEADAIVSTGNREALIAIDEAEHVLGGEIMIETGENALNAQKVPLNHYFCSNSQLGAWKLSMNAM